MENYSKHLQVEALKENLVAIELCLNFSKQNAPSQNWEIPQGILGFPALILISSIIDSIGSFYRGTQLKIPVDGEDKKIKTIGDHFLILNQPNIFGQSFSQTTITDFYETYRCKATHNNVLPSNNFIKIGKDSEPPFITTIDNKIEVINLKPLFNLTKKAVDNAIYFIKTGNLSDDHKLSKELQESEKSINPYLAQFVADTGDTQTYGTNVP